MDASEGYKAPLPRFEAALFCRYIGCDLSLTCYNGTCYNGAICHRISGVLITRALHLKALFQNLEECKGNVPLNELFVITYIGLCLHICHCNHWQHGPISYRGRAPCVSEDT